jgi:hypothetical protein
LEFLHCWYKPFGWSKAGRFSLAKSHRTTLQSR